MKRDSDIVAFRTFDEAEPIDIKEMEKNVLSQMYDKAKKILSGGIVACHGTELKKALKIVNYGLGIKGFDKPTLMPFFKDSNPLELARYWWKAADPREAAAVVIEVPNEFLSQLYKNSDEINELINGVKKENELVEFFRKFYELEIPILSSADDHNKDHTPSFSSYVFPRPFIRGFFKNNKGKCYLHYDGFNVPQDDIDFYESPLFFSNLSREEQEAIVRYYRRKFGFEENIKATDERQR